MRVLSRFLLSLLFITSVATCGQQGPLYLPEEGPADEEPAVFHKLVVKRTF